MIGADEFGLCFELRGLTCINRKGAETQGVAYRFEYVYDA